MTELVAFVACALVDHPEAVEVTPVEEPDALVLELRVAPDDLGKVIGKGGRTARALRTLVGAAAVKTGRRVLVDIVE